MTDGDAQAADLWPSIPAVLRVMAGWFLLGIGLLNLGVEMDGGLTGAYVVFHLVLAFGGTLLLTRQRVSPSRAARLVAGLAALAGLAVGAVPATARCCLAAYPQRHGYPFPFLGTGAGMHVSVKYLIADVIFWGCAGLLLVTAIAVVERRLPERRTPVDLTGLGGHARVSTGENVGGLT